MRRDIIHLNCGLHDIKRLPPTEPCQISLDEYPAAILLLGFAVEAAVVALAKPFAPIVPPPIDAAK